MRVVNDQIYSLFPKCLYTWAKKNDRQLPWKNESNPYLIWLSEIILQQTRVEQGLPYFQRFKNAFPTVESLANATEDEVFKLWQGLGYYSRARNMHFSAKYIQNELNGVFPDTYKGLKLLKGVGDYTAAAIASFAYQLPHAVVDGNVYRVLSRVFGVETPIDSTAGKKLFAELAAKLLDEKKPGKYNQAIMDFGATQCTPKTPKCNNCVLSEYCVAKKENTINRLPVKAKKIKKKSRFFHYLLINQAETVLINKREAKDIWSGLYDFPLIEKDTIMPFDELMETKEWKIVFPNDQPVIKQYSKTYQQTLSHQKISAVFLEVEMPSSYLATNLTWKKINRENLNKFAFPKIITWFLTDKTLYLNIK